MSTKIFLGILKKVEISLRKFFSEAFCAVHKILAFLEYEDVYCRISQVILKNKTTVQLR